MRPILVHIGTLAVPSHDACIALGVVLAALVFAGEVRRCGVQGDERLLWIAAAALAGGALGAKLATAWQYVALTGDATLGGILVRGGRSILGGLTGAYAGAVLAKHALRYAARTGDLFVPGVALGMAVGRVGCLLAEPPGAPNALGWGIRLTADEAARIPGCPAWCAAGVPLHPSFAYESAFHLLAVATLWWWLRAPGAAARRARTPEGALWVRWLLAYGAFRFAVEFVRGHDVAWLGLTRSQLFLLAALPLVAWRVATLRRIAPAAPLAAPA